MWRQIMKVNESVSIEILSIRQVAHYGFVGGVIVANHFVHRKRPWPGSSAICRVWRTDGIRGVPAGSSVSDHAHQLFNEFRPKQQPKKPTNPILYRIPRDTSRAHIEFKKEWNLIEMWSLDAVHYAMIERIEFDCFYLQEFLAIYKV